jgi:hypothetical protein
MKRNIGSSCMKPWPASCRPIHILPPDINSQSPMKIGTAMAAALAMLGLNFLASPKHRAKQTKPAIRKITMRMCPHCLVSTNKQHQAMQSFAAIALLYIA